MEDRSPRGPAVAPKAFSRGDWWAVLALGAAAVGFRIGSVAALSGDLRIKDPILDARYYLELATRLRESGWPEGPIFMNPLFPLVLSGIFHFAPAAPLSVILFHSLLGLATAFLLVATARRDLGRAAGWAAGALFTLSGPVLAMETQILGEPLLLFLVTASLWFWPAPHHGRLHHLFFGFSSGLLAIGRGSFLLLPLAALLPLRRSRAPRDRGESKTARRIVWVGLGVLAALLPLAVHQTRATGSLNFLTLNGGMNLYVGNNLTARGLFSAPPDLDLESDLTGTRSASILAGRALAPEESSRYWAGRSFEFWREQPGRALWLLTRKALLYLSPAEIPQIEDFQVLAETALPLRLAFVRFGWILPLATLGLILGGRQGPSGSRAPRSERPGPRWPMLAPYLIVISIGWLSTVLFFATGRHRLPFLPGFLGPAAVGLATLFAMMRNYRASLPRLGFSIMVLFGVAGLQQLLPRYPVQEARAFDAVQLGSRLTRQGRAAEALEQYREASRRNPTSGEAWHGMGVVLVQLGRLPEAAETYRKAIEFLPASALTHYNLGIVHGRLGQNQEALAELQLASGLDPLNLQIRCDYGVALANNGRTNEAVAEWRAVLHLEPGHAAALRNLRAVGAER